jgi:hypothetical protein
LTRIRKYKTIITAVFLTVYAFIATPVQLWHHHDYKVNTDSVKSAKEKCELTVFTSVEQPTDANCKVCSHHYSMYHHDATIELEISPLILTLKTGCYFFSIPSASLLNSSNKGPPSAA